MDVPPIPSLPFCQPTSPSLLFLSSQLHTCIPTPLAAISSLLGILSITSWLFAQLPQIATNYRLKSTSGLSFLFLLNWMLGDSCNLLGATLLDQMTFQKVIAGYYVIVDAVLIIQWAWYTARASTIERVKSTGGISHQQGVMAVLSLLFCLGSASPTRGAQQQVHGFAFFNQEEDEWQHLGRVLSWASTILYVSSRTPQLWLNYQRRSVKGLSPNLFMAAFFGNLFYSSSLLANPSAWSDMEAYGGGGWVGENGSVRSEWWWDTLPFFLGAAGVLSFDACVGWQFLLWGEKDNEEVIEGTVVQPPVVVEEEDAKKRDEAVKRKRFMGIKIRRDERTEQDEEESLLGTTLNGGRIYGTYSPASRSYRDVRSAAQ